jgi:hypothetical protein
MVILRTYPDATVKLVERLGGRPAFAAKIREELPAYLYWLLNEFQIPGELKETRFGMKAFRNQEIVEMVQETAPYMQLLEVMEKQFAGSVEKEFTLTDLAGELDNPNTPQGIRLMASRINTLGRYLSILATVTTKIVKIRTNKGTRYALTFPTDQDSKAAGKEATKTSKQAEAKWEKSHTKKMHKQDAAPSPAP